MFDFSNQYKTCSNVDLLMIVKQPDGYEKEAVEAATAILSGRQVTEDDILVVNNLLLQAENSNRQKKELVESVKRKAASILENSLDPNKKMEIRQWVTLLLVVIAIRYAFTLYDVIKLTIYLLQNDDSFFDFFITVNYLTVIYVPLIFILVLKRKPLGWVFLFADTLFSFICGLSQSYIFFKYQHIHGGDTTSFLWPLFIKAILIAFLWKEQATAHFAVSNSIKRKTVFVTTLVTLAFLSIVYITFRT